MNKPEIKMTRSGLYLLKNSSKTTLLLLLWFCVGPRTVLICDREIPFTSTGHLYIYTRKKTPNWLRPVNRVEERGGERKRWLRGGGQRASALLWWRGMCGRVSEICDKKITFLINILEYTISVGLSFLLHPRP